MPMTSRSCTIIEEEGGVRDGFHGGPQAGRVELDDLVEPGTEALDPVHPGEILRDCLDDLGMSAYALAEAIRVPVTG